MRLPLPHILENNGDKQFRNVVLDMLPTPAGKLLGGNWELGESEIRSDSWNYQPYVEDMNELAVAAFVQDRNTGKILQASVNHQDKPVEVRNTLEVSPLHIYPNPAKNTIHVNLGRTSRRSRNFQVIGYEWQNSSNRTCAARLSDLPDWN